MSLTKCVASILMASFFIMSSAKAQTDTTPDLNRVAEDLTIPPVSNGTPAPGRRVSQTTEDWQGTAVHHLLYLPKDWQPGVQYPVLVEYAGNGGYKNKYGDVSEGTVEGSRLGYGISAGKGYLWLCLPYVEIKTV